VVPVLTHHPEDTAPADEVTFLNCGPAEAVRIGLAAAGGKNLEVFSPTIGRQLLALGLIDEIDLHIAPVLLGEGVRLYDNPGRAPIRLHRVGEGNARRPSTYGTDLREQRSSRPRQCRVPERQRLASGHCRAEAAVVVARLRRSS
jgi:dihydrofolate reductase